jgi:phosphomannomutase
MASPKLHATARTWADSAIDPEDTLVIKTLIESSETGDEVAQAELASMFSGPMRFGTAGLRALMGAGESRMNSSVVAQASWGFAQWLRENQGQRIVIGFDARNNSQKFARVCAEVFAGAGLEVQLASDATPTPLLAFGVRHQKADAGVMITASHNPRNDNGFKVYLSDGCQIAPPVDSQIAAHINLAPPANLIARSSDNIYSWPTSLTDAYCSAAAAVVNQPSFAVPTRLIHSWVYTPMHGVGFQTLRTVLKLARLPEPVVVAAQAQPDGEFPTLPFPNPEESGALDLAFKTAEESQAELVIANDPDADRCAVALETTSGWYQFTGDEIGALLAWWQLNVRRVQPDLSSNPAMATTLVSSRLIGEIANQHGYKFVTTLTGFKWISRVPGLVFGYEEALGYCVDPTNVKDKDGITAALAILDLYEFAKSQGKTLIDLLDEIYISHGLHFTQTRSTRLTDANQASEIVTSLAVDSPSQIGRFSVTRLEDLARGVDGLPPTTGVRFFVTDNARVIIRPSGTESKVKTYLEIITPTTWGRLAADKAQSRELAEEIFQALAESVLCPAP